MTLPDLLIHSPPRRPSTTGRRIAQVAGSACALLGASVIVGWFAHQPWLIQVRSSFVPMQFNTALGFLALGVALLTTPRRGAAIGLIAGVLGTLTLVEYVADVDMKIDQLFMEHYLTTHTSHPGRMAPNTAFCFMASSGALWAFYASRKRDRDPEAVLLASVVLSLAIVPLIGYAFDLPLATGVANLTRMAVHTAVGFVLFGVGLLGNAGLRGAKQASFTPWLATLLPLVGTLSLWQTLEADARAAREADARQRANTVSSELSLAIEAQIASLVRMSQRWRQRPPDAEYFRSDATLFVNHSRLLYAVAAVSHAPSERLPFPTWFVDETGTVANEKTQQQLRGWVDEALARPAFSPFHDPTAMVRCLTKPVPGEHDDLLVMVPLPEDAWLIGILKPWPFVKAAARHHSPFRFTLDHQLDEQTPTTSTLDAECITPQHAEPIRLGHINLRIGAITSQSTDNFARWMVLIFGSCLAIAAGMLARRVQAWGSRATQLQSLIQASPVAKLLLDEHGTIVMINPRVEQLMGYSASELLGQPVEILLPPSVREAQRQHSLEFVSASNVQIMGKEEQLFGKHRDGQSVPLDIVLGPLELGSKVYVQVQLIDVTTRYEAMRAIQAQAVLLERSNHELEQFAYVASHDLRAPLRAITNLSEWIEEDLQEHLTPETREHITLMRARIARMETLLNSLLKYARIGSGDSMTEPVPTRDLVEEIRDLVGPPPGFTIRLEEPAPVLQTSRTALRLVLLNLVTNAIKHHDRNSGTVTLRVLERDDSWEFVVQDDGPGIAPEFRERIFEMFQTLKRRDEHEASGMGLAMVRKQLLAHGGEIRCESAAPRGSIFRFWWPRDETAIDLATGRSHTNIRAVHLVHTDSTMPTPGE